ncbi:hypothetical protein PanWU01x14_125650 [Parasponia andersonii]|uniref:Uncharacterized protein n=1 Tax=Parasponia andersonii TaxID=3476 RepID=A0A2P5CT98_PARAD|nr:hypothetical protein PanWU01x14_125650 [Parasponia andersonii]
MVPLKSVLETIEPNSKKTGGMPNLTQGRGINQLFDLLHMELFASNIGWVPPVAASLIRRLLLD